MLGRKWIGRISAGLALAGVLAMPPAAALAADKVDTIRIAVVSAYAGGKVRLSGIDYAIEQQGWLKSELAKRGMTFEWYAAPNAAVGPMVNEAFANHSIQFAGYSDLPSIILNGSGSGARTQLLVPGNPSDSFLVVPKNSTAKTIVDLKGKRLAIHKGRPWELPLLRLLDSKGLDYDDFKIYNINPDAGAAAVATGAIDGLFTVSAYGLEAKNVAKIIWSTKDAPLSWKSWGGFWGDRDFIEKHPDIAQLVVTAYVKGAYWASQESSRDTIIKLGTVTGTPEAIVRRTYDDPSLSWHDRWSPLASPALYEHYRDAIVYSLQKKIIRKNVNADELINDTFVLKALKDLNLENYWTTAKGAQRPQSAAGEPRSAVQ